MGLWNDRLLATRNLIQKFHIKFAILGLLLGLVLLPFQNCAPTKFVDPTLAQFSQMGYGLQVQYVHVEWNQKKSWMLEGVGDFSGIIISLNDKKPENKIDLPEGTVILTGGFRAEFTPRFGFRGIVKVPVFGLNKTGSVRTQAEITIDVGNRLAAIQPALALRAAGCVMCHADIRSNIVTDFGYGDSFYLGQLAPGWNLLGIHGDHSNSEQHQSAWASSRIGGDDPNQPHSFKVFVPNAQTTPAVRATTGANNLVELLRYRFNQSNLVSTRSTQIESKRKIFIGTPSASKLKEYFRWNEDDQSLGYKFFPENHQTSLPLQGLRMNGRAAGLNVFSHDDILVCEGDLMLDGVLVLDGLKLKSRTGCRIYVTNDIYIHGPIEFITDNENSYERRNIQLLASRSILMGLGDTWNGDTHCEKDNPQSQWYWTELVPLVRDKRVTQYTGAQRDEQIKIQTASDFFRLTEYSLYFFLRGVSDPKQWHEDVRKTYRAVLPNAKDAACQAVGRNIRYERVLFNTPTIHNRYTGGIKGSVITEFPLMSLGVVSLQEGGTKSRFQFEFDPVLTQVPVLPVIPQTEFFDVE